MMMVGAFSDKEVNQEHKDLIADKKDEINSKLGINASSFSVDKVWSQVVAGTNYFFHLSADGKPYSVKIFKPLPHTNAPAEVKEASEGHNSHAQ